MGKRGLKQMGKYVNNKKNKRKSHKVANKFYQQPKFEWQSKLLWQKI